MLFINLFQANNFEGTNANVCLLTMTIGFMEYRDNSSIAKKVDIETIEITKLLIATHMELLDIVICTPFMHYPLLYNSLKN